MRGDLPGRLRCFCCPSSPCSLCCCLLTSALDPLHAQSVAGCHCPLLLSHTSHVQHAAHVTLDRDVRGALPALCDGPAAAAAASPAQPKPWHAGACVVATLRDTPATSRPAGGRRGAGCGTCKRHLQAMRALAHQARCLHTATSAGLRLRVPSAPKSRLCSRPVAGPPLERLRGGLQGRGGKPMRAGGGSAALRRPGCRALPPPLAPLLAPPAG